LLNLVPQTYGADASAAVAALRRPATSRAALEPAQPARTLLASLNRHLSKRGALVRRCV
jgi:hypothetical protein